jgi:RNA polymerase sigma-70 factor (ECF subfamily)
MALPEEQRSVLELVAVEGCSYKEAAAVLDIPIGTVMSRLARARSALADRVQDETFPAGRSGGEGHE